MRSRWLAYALVATAVACSEGSDEGPDTINNPVGALPGGTAGGPGGLLDAGGTGLPPAVGGGATVGGGLVAGAGGVTAGTQPGGAAGGAMTGGAGGSALPCDVQKILKDKCQTCHSNPVVGAPMPLVTLADFQAASGSKPAEKNWQRAKARINETGATSMPPPGRPALTAAEKSTLDAFLTGGAKGVAATTCAPVTTPGGTAGGGTTGGVAIGGDWQPPDSDCDVLMELRAHGGQGASDTTPYSPAGNGDQYEIFWYAPTWNEKMHVIRIDPIIDNGAILHHWLLYMKERGSEPVGSHNSDSGLQSSDSALLSGWAPGNKNIPLGTEVGLQVVQGSAARFGIEIHYNTSSNPANRKDRSGARLCLTKKLRPKEAATHWLGTQAIIGLGKFDAVGTCSVKMESHIIAHSPHMHKTGRYMKTIISKQGGGMQTITDKPFAFDDQQIFPVDAAGGEIVVKPGDKITTTCSYDAPGLMTFGPGTNSEMCYNFVIAYPVGSLSNGSPGLVGGKNTCIDGL